MDIGSLYPDSEDLMEAFNREFAMLRETMGNIETLFKRTLECKQFLDDEETAQLLHCSVNEIPTIIPKYRGSKRGYLRRYDEIIDYLESKRLPKRQ